jgi:hypothetical protein
VDDEAFAKARVSKLWPLSSLQANYGIGLSSLRPLMFLHPALARLKILAWHRGFATFGLGGYVNRALVAILSQVGL